MSSDLPTRPNLEHLKKQARKKAPGTAGSRPWCAVGRRSTRGRPRLWVRELAEAAGPCRSTDINQRTVARLPLRAVLRTRKARHVFLQVGSQPDRKPDHRVRTSPDRRRSCETGPGERTPTAFRTACRGGTSRCDGCLLSDARVDATRDDSLFRDDKVCPRASRRSGDEPRRQPDRYLASPLSPESTRTFDGGPHPLAVRRERAMAAGQP